MNLPFSKKKPKEQVIPGKGFVPVDRVREMAARGFSEPEMIDILRREGFSADEVDKALTQALRMGVTGEQEQTQQSQQPQWQPAYQRQPTQERQRQPEPQKSKEPEHASGLPTLESIGAQPTQESMPQIPETSLPEGYYSQQYSNEDYVDYIVQQRMAEVTEKVREFESQYQALQKKIQDLSEQLKSALTKSSPVQSQISSKMDSFAETVTDMDNRLSGLEKAFKETLPELIDSVRTLSDLVQKVRKEKE